MKNVTPLTSFSVLEPWPIERQGDFLRQNGVEISYSDGQTIFDCGDESTDIYFILSGAVKSINVSSGGQLTYFRLRQAGDVFGYYSGVTGKPRSASMIAVGETRLCKMAAEPFMREITHDPVLAKKFIKLLADLLRAETERLTGLTVLSSAQRVAADLVTRAAQADNLNVSSRLEWAGYLGISRETLSRILNDLAAQGAITIDSTNIFIRDLQMLRDMI